MRILIVDDEELVLEKTRSIVKGTKPEAEVFCADNYMEALKVVKEHRVDVALLDIELPGMNGLELAKTVKEMAPDTNIIFVTAFSQYALEAFSVYPSGYLMKPLKADELSEALENLRIPVQYEPGKIRIQCFGKFEAFYNNEPIAFSRAKTKEVLAYLVDLKGAAANTGELCAALWEDSTEELKCKHYLRNLIADLKKTLCDCKAEDVFICKRNYFAIDVNKVECDYYKYLDKDVSAINSYRGEYMKQYSWAEFSVKHV